MTVEHQHNGSILITDIIDNQLVKEVYYDYTENEVVADFR